jgi:hypothetical protein
MSPLPRSYVLLQRTMHIGLALLANTLFVHTTNCDGIC